MGEAVFKQMMSLYVEPEIARRVKAGLLAEGTEIKMIQVLFFDDGSHRVRVNEEVKAHWRVKLKKGIPKDKGEAIYLHEVEEFKPAELVEEELDCAHVTMASIADRWNITFSFIYNQKSAQAHLAAAEEFYLSAKDNMDKGRFRPFVDNLFSSSELAAKALLLSLPMKGIKDSKRHGNTRDNYNRLRHSGMVQEELTDAFNILGEGRYPARYLDSTFTMTLEMAQKLAAAVRKIIDHAKGRIIPTTIEGAG